MFGSHTQKLWVDYIYLDTDERRRFAQVSHEYLIEQLQYQEVSSTQTQLYFNHPVKELIWCPNTKVSSDGKSPNTKVTGTEITLKLNGHDVLLLVIEVILLDNKYMIITLVQVD